MAASMILELNTKARDPSATSHTKIIVCTRGINDKRLLNLACQPDLVQESLAYGCEKLLSIDQVGHPQSGLFELASKV